MLPAHDLRLQLGLAIPAVVAVAVLAGCGGDEAKTWEGPPRPLPANGNLPVEEFNAYLDDAGEPPTLSRLTIATAYVLPIVGDAASLSVAQLTETAGGPPPIEVLVRPNDDSVREQRYELAVEDTLEGFRLASGRWAQRCHTGRGHQDWSTEPCL
jgi:hypothetical protein